MLQIPWSPLNTLYIRITGKICDLNSQCVWEPGLTPSTKMSKLSLFKIKS